MKQLNSNPATWDWSTLAKASVFCYALAMKKTHEFDFTTEETCPNCGSMVQYSHKYDTTYCVKENVWLESKCADKNCQFCPKRPNKPII